MAIIDSQVHAYEANTPKRPWHSVPNWPAHVTGDEMVAAMDKVGVDGAIFISPFSMYQYDASYAVEVQRAHPGRFALVTPVDPDNPAVAEVIAAWKETPGTVGIRIMMTQEAGRNPNDPGLDRILAAHERERTEEVHLLRWHLDRARARIAALQPHLRPGILIHGDFTPWNLRYLDGRLSGILDFELAHHDHRVADFALSWRGRYDARRDDARPRTARVCGAERGRGAACAQGGAG